MAIRCSHCNSEYDVTLFGFKDTMICTCGNIINLQHKEILAELPDNFRGFGSAKSMEDEKMNAIKNLSDKIAFLIVSTDYPDIDLEIEKEKFRETIHELFPEKAYLYELIYEPRFKRLKEQFRNSC